MAVCCTALYSQAHVIQDDAEPNMGDCTLQLTSAILLTHKYSHLYFFFTDLLGYVRNLLGVKRATFNLLPIAHLLKMPQELINLVTKSWKEDDDQLGMILQHWLKENDVVEGIATLRKDLEKFKPEG